MSKEPQNLRIVSLRVSNVKRVRAVEIVPKGNVIRLQGRNKQGKSSILDAIAMAIGGKDLIGPSPLRTGAEKGQVEVKLGDDLIVTRKFTKAGTTVTVSNAAGAEYRSPQAILDALYGRLTFDPFEFTRMGETPDGRKQQRETLLSLAGLDFSGKDREKQAKFDERTNVNRNLEQAKARLARLAFDDKAPTEEVTVTQLLDELQKVTEHNEKNQNARNDVDDLKVAVDNTERAYKDADVKLRELLKQIKELEEAHQEAVRTHAQAERGVNKLQDKDPQPIKDRILSAEIDNGRVRANQSYTAEKNVVAGLEAQSKALTSKIEAVTEEKLKAIKETKFPFEGISFDDRGVLLDGEPWEQGSTAEQLAASVAMGMALNPKLKVMFCRNASLMDDESQAIIYKLAADKGYQVWMECVSSDDPTAVVIEDGQVVTKQSKSE